MRSRLTTLGGGSVGCVSPESSGNATTSIALDSDELLGQKRPDRANRTQDGEQHEQPPQQRLLPVARFLPEELQVETYGQDDADEGTQGRAEEGANGVKGGEGDGDEE